MSSSLMAVRRLRREPTYPPGQPRICDAAFTFQSVEVIGASESQQKSLNILAYNLNDDDGHSSRVRRDERL